MIDRVREPIQVYLTKDERAELDEMARSLGVSRSEMLRRGIRAAGRRRLPGVLSDLGERELVTPAAAEPGPPPPSRPVVSLDQLLCELAEDRSDR